MSTPVNWYRDGRLHFAAGIEDTFVPQGGPGQRPIDEYELTDHYGQFYDDLGLATEVGAEFLRWGVPWHRVNPAPGQWDWAWLDRVMGRFAELGLTPIVDLLHYGTPLWLDGQFSHRDFPGRFAEFAVQVASRYADVATDFTPVNEPMIHALFSGEYGYWPPYLHGQAGLVKMVEALGRGFVLAQHGIREALGDAATFVHVDAGFRYAGDVAAPEHRDQVTRLQQQRYLVEDLVTGRVGAGHPLAGMLARAGMSDHTFDWFVQHPARPDVMGVNYYPQHSTEIFQTGVHHGGGFADPRPTRDDGVTGLAEVLHAYADRYRVPVMLTETCVTGSVAQRLDWLDRSVATCLSLRAQGLPLVGYTWWPLFDMYEWTYRHSSGPRSDHLLTMGLWDLVEYDGRLARVKNPVAQRFAALVAAHGAVPVGTPR